jgi:dipeptidyl aminopeptidase/acylaminoacyl peptidase
VLVVVKIAPYGTWISPIAAEDVARTSGGPRRADLHDGQVWWAELRPAEGGRLALMRADVTAPGGTPTPVLPAPWNVRNRLHEYGGRPWTVLGRGADARVAFTEWADQRVYLADPNVAAADVDPVPISPVPERPHGYRYGDLRPGPDGSEVWCVRETSTGELPTDIRRELVALPCSGAAATDPGAVRVLAASHHFLTGPQVSPDGRRVAWIGWNHPNMPWDGTELCVAELDEQGRFGPHRVLAGGPTEAVCQVEWDSPEELLALTDPTGWWNLYRITLDGRATNLAPCEEELGGPMWTVGPRWFVKVSEGRFVVLRDGKPALLDEAAGTLVDLPVDLPSWSADLAAADGVLTSIAAGPIREDAVVRLDLASGALTELTAQSAELPDPAYLPLPRHRSFADEQGRPIPAFVYPPTNPEYAAPEGELPPYLVYVHGGPTGAFHPELAMSVAYFTSRGIGVVAVNYGGSTGYGREFRERLREQWGVVDVADCAAVARALAEEGTADGRRLAIRGGSAGGWTTAASLTSELSRDVYRCGTVMYPILDLVGWTATGGQTHDFESRYVEGLVGRLPEHADRYHDRSPARHADRLAGPVLMLQGLEDQICPPVQADEFMANLEGSGIPHAYLTFDGEQHGFRKAETIRVALEAELSFYGQILGFTTPGVDRLELSK